MKIISTASHGVLDYFAGFILVAAPWVLGFAREGAETFIPVILGMGLLIYSLCTNYEWSVFRVISMRTHLTLDFISGLILLTSPWIFGFYEFVFWPHLLAGMAIMIASLTTDHEPFRRLRESLRSPY